VREAGREGRSLPRLLDLDIRKFFDSLDHRLVVKAVKANTDQKWVLLYLKRWLVAPLQLRDGTLQNGTVEPHRVRRARLQRSWQLLFRRVVDVSTAGTAAACRRQRVTFLVVLLCHVWCWWY
jgi:hypothetical protein